MASVDRARSTAATSGSRAARSHSSCCRRSHPPPERPATCPQTARSCSSGEWLTRHLGEKEGEGRVLKGFEEGEQQPLFRPEVGVDGPGRPVGGLGHGVDRNGVDSLAGEELGGGRQKPGAGVRLALLLRAGGGWHRSTVLI